MTSRFPQSLTGFDCKQCASPLDFDFSFAFQPIVDLRQGRIWGYEALVRGRHGESATSVLSLVNDNNRYAFDQLCRVKAITLAAALGLRQILSINFLPNAVYEPAHCIRSTLEAARQAGFPADRIMFEVAESERVPQPGHLTRIFEYYRSQGFITALDDFGSGHSGLTLLSCFLPTIIKIDMALIRDIPSNRAKQVIVTALLDICQQLDIKVLAEGIETAEELAWLEDRGVRLIQGYYFARPGFECLHHVSL